MVILSGPGTMIVGNWSKEKRRSMCRYVVEVRSTLLELRSSMLRNKSDLKKRDKSLCFDKSKISDFFLFRKHEFKYV